MTGERRSRWLTVTVVVIASAVHLRAWIAHPNPINPDSESYIEPAMHLLRDHQFAAADRIAYAVPPRAFAPGPIVPDTIRTPVYPLLIAAFMAIGASLRALTLLQHILAVALAALLQVLLRKRVSPICGAAAALLVALHPAVVDTANVVLTETVTAAIVAAAVASLYRSTIARSSAFAALAGGLLGVAALTRPIVMYLPLMLIAVLLVRRIPWRVVIVFAVAFSVLPLAWTLRNYEKTGVATVSSIAGEDLLLYRAAGTLVVASKPPFDALFALQKQFGYYHSALVIRVPLVKQALREAEAEGRRPANHAQRSQEYSRLARKTLLAHPFAYAEIAFSAFIALVVDDMSAVVGSHGEDIDDARLRFVPLSLLILVCAVGGIWRLLKIDRDAGLLLGATVIYFVAISCGPGVEPRFVVPYLPLYACAASVGLDAFLHRTRPQSARTLESEANGAVEE
jgi:hypothetical protein